MDELIGQLTEKVGIDTVVAEKTIGLTLDFRRKERPSDKVQALIDKIAGAEVAIANPGNCDLLARLIGGGQWALGTRQMALGQSEIQKFAGGLFRFGRDTIGTDQMGETIAGTPGLGQFA